MASIRTPRQLVTQASAKKYHNLGDRYIQPATTSSIGEREYMYVQYDDGTANITANTQQLLVPKGSDLNVYTADKSDMSSIVDGRFSAVCRADVTTTSNKYIWVQVRGEAHIYAGGTVAAAGNALIAGGTDKQATVFTGGITATTTAMLQGASVFAVANAAAAATTSKLSFNMIGF